MPTLEEFDFELPPEQIAQEPLPERSASRLMVLSAPLAPEHRHFSELPQLLRAGDLLVVNDTQVIPARLLGRKEGTGGKVELLLVRPVATGEWRCLGQASKGLKVGARVELPAGVTAEVTEVLGGGEYRVRFDCAPETFSAWLEGAGRLPLPPYIEREPRAEDRERYQTVYARHAGSVAAPTAGLHFTPEVLAQLEERGIQRTSITLEVGPGTFLPVRDGDLSAHRMHGERYRVSPEAAAAIGKAKAEGRRVVAVGTTVVRTLESAEVNGVVPAGEGETALFIQPGYAFSVVDALVTNFHLPKSTLLMLVSAFLGTERTLAAYREAVARGYRFFSYGDAMLIQGRAGG